MSSGLDANTNALSVYNVLSIERRPLTQREIVALLRERWNTGFDSEDLAAAVAVLKSIKAVRNDGNKLDCTRRNLNGRGTRLMRAGLGQPLFFAEGML